MAGSFELVLVAIGAYEHFEPLPSGATADRVEHLLAPYGVESVRRAEHTTNAGQLLDFLDEWADDPGGPGPTLIYWVGHGTREGRDAWLLSGASQSPLTDRRAVKATAVADRLRMRWTERTAGDGSWTVLVLDCCRGRDAATAIVNTLTSDFGSRPEQMAVVEVGGSSATEVGRFVDALENALQRFTENDAAIPMRTLLLDVTDSLATSVQPTIWLSRDASIPNPRATPTAIAVPQDLLTAWRAAVATLEPSTRDHFLEKAKSTDFGELAWNFVGREAESTQIANWLRDADAGMLVVTGEPGAGKSALLGRFVAMADPHIADVLSRAELVDTSFAAPEPGIFDCVLHLTGKTVGETRQALQDALPGLAAQHGGLTFEKPRSGRVTVLVDALDEAQSPQGIISELLRPLAEISHVRLIVGTRRSLSEGPDLAVADHSELLDDLGVSDSEVLVLEREPTAMAAYARQRLDAEGSTIDPGLTEYIVERIGAVAQPFLFVRLALHEVLARRDGLDRATVDSILGRDHGGIFRLAMARMADQRPSTAHLVRALAYGQGRGVPEHDRVWATMAAALTAEVQFGSDTVAEALRDAAPYVVLDGEHDQSVYRLAHKTFSERFLADDPDPLASHRAIADALMALVGSEWREANPYVLAFLPRHAAGSPLHLDRVVTDPDWLDAVLRRFGIDGLVAAIDAVPLASRTPATTLVLGALRRGRVSLAREPAQLAAQLHSRLHRETEPAVRALVERLPTIAPLHWLRVTDGGAAWTASGDVTMTFAAKIRALASGRLRGRPGLAVGNGDKVSWWEPSSGAMADLFSTGGERVTALAMTTVRGQDLVAVAARYDGTVTVYSPDGTPQRRIGDLHSDHVAIGVQAGVAELAVALGSEVSIYALDSVEPVPRRVVSLPGDVLALHYSGGASVALRRGLEGLCVQRLGEEARIPVPGVATVAQALVDVEGDLVVVVGSYDSVEAWSLGAGTSLGRIDLGGEFIARTATAVMLGDSLMLAAGNDTDYENGYVMLRDPNAAPAEGSGRVHPKLTQAVAMSASASIAVLVESGRLVVIDPRDTGDSPRRGGERADAEQLAALDDACPTTVPGSDQVRGGPVPSVAAPARLRTSRPQDWPVNVRAFGSWNGAPVVATASFDGVCWLWSAETAEVVAGPFGVRRPDIRMSAAKGAPQPSRDVAFRSGPDGAVIARVHQGELDVWDVSTGEPLDIEGARAPGAASAVALGEIDGRTALARGAEGGAISVWSARTGERLCGLTLDSGVRRLWFEPGAATLVALTHDNQLHLMDVVTGNSDGNRGRAPNP